MKTGYECTTYFKGIDGLGSCDSGCQWWHKGACPCARGSEFWDGKEHYTKDPKEATMSDELGREELLKEAKEVFDHYFDDLRDYPSEVIVKQAYQQIKALIQKPEVTEEWIEEKAKDLITMVAELYPREGSPCVIPKSKARDFIRKLVK